MEIAQSLWKPTSLALSSLPLDVPRDIMPHHNKLQLADAELLKEHVAFIDGKWVAADTGEDFDVYGAFIIR